jgi:RHS repeat-associated protein
VPVADALRGGSNPAVNVSSYFLGGQRIAQRVGSGPLTFLHTDHVGSTRLTTRGDGTDRYSQQYHAFGAKRGGGLFTTWRFTGQEEDPATGLVYMHARYYDPATGHFISPDTLVPEPARLLAVSRAHALTRSA